MNTRYLIIKLVWRNCQRRSARMCTILMLAFFVTGCSIINRYSLHSGISYVAPRGNPPAEKLIWSRVDMNNILVSASEYGFGNSQVFILDVSTGKTRIIAETDHGIINTETWSPDETKIVLDIDSATSGYENTSGLWIWDAQEIVPIDFLGERGLAVWSPSGKTIAIFDSSDGLQVLYQIDTNNSDKKSVTIGNTNTIGYVLGADWSPDEQNLVLSLGDPKSSIDANLFIYSIESNNIERLTNEGDTYNPIWSPLGDKIAYIKHSRGKGSDSLHLISINGNCDIELPGVDWAQSLTWSPDGKKLAFIGSDGIYIMELEPFLTENFGTNGCQ